MGRAASLGIAICLVVAGRDAGAQERKGVGAQVGYSRADLSGQSSDLARSRQGAITGVYLHFPVNQVASVRPHLPLTQLRLRPPDQVRGQACATLSPIGMGARGF
jgi:hypothetical protein